MNPTIEMLTKFENKKTAEIIRHLPEELVVEILSLLPAKSLLRFRCVSKSWCTLISTPRFIKSHLKNSSSTTTDLTRHGIVMSNFQVYHNKLQLCSLKSLLYEPAVARVLDYDYPNGDVKVVGSCNGPICLLIDHRNFILWNPCTRNSKKLPYAKWGIQFYAHQYGFGYDESKDDYKIFAVLHVVQDSNYNNDVRVKVYSLKNNSWKKVEYRKILSPDRSGTFVNGKLYWAMSGFAPVCEWAMDLFDLQNEVFGKIKHPLCSGFKDKVDFETVVGVMEGYLCVSCYCLKENKIDIWIFRESWNKVVSLSGVRLSLEYYVPWAIMLCMGINGEILLSNGSSLLVYNLKDQLFRRPKTINFYAFRQVDVYIESLVSLELNHNTYIISRYNTYSNWLKW